METRLFCELSIIDDFGGVYSELVYLKGSVDKNVYLINHEFLTGKSIHSIFQHGG